MSVQIFSNCSKEIYKCQRSPNAMLLYDGRGAPSRLPSLPSHFLRPTLGFSPCTLLNDPLANTFILSLGSRFHHCSSYLHCRHAPFPCLCKYINQLSIVRSRLQNPWAETFLGPLCPKMKPMAYKYWVCFFLQNLP